jgi:acyl-CoA dehydrogenase
VTGMDFAMSAKGQDFHERLSEFMTEHVFPAEESYDAYRHAAGPDDHTVPPVVEELKKLAKDRGLWNLFLPSESGLTNLEYAPLAELTGWSMELAPEATNCAAPDTGNMETLHLFATEAQSKQWLEPLLNGEIRSAFAMTEPAVASSDARNIETTMLRDGGDYVINGRKWWISGASDPRCKVLIVMGRTNPDAASHQQQSMILVPIDTPGVTVERSLPVFGWQDQHGHCELSFDNVRVPVANLLGEEGGGFVIAQARLGPGRIHHCMRAIGVAERAMALMVNRVNSRIAFGKPLAAQGVVQQQVALSRNEIDQARLLCHKAAWTIDAQGNQSKDARQQVAMIKAVAPQMACNVIDRAIQVHGAAGVSDDTVLARLYGWHRAMRLFDGPDEVHMRTIARNELGREKSAFAAAVTP